VIGVLGSITLLMASFGIQDSVKNANQNIYGKQYSYYEKIEINNISDKEKENAENILQGDFQWINEGSAEVRTKNNVKTCTIDIIDNGYYLTLTNDKGSVIDLPTDGVVISETLAKELGISENEYLKIYELSKNYVVKVDKIIPLNTPQAIFISNVYWKKVGGVFLPTSLFVGNNSNIDKIENQNYSKNVYILKSQLKEADDVLSSIKAIIFMLIAAAVLLSIVILYNLGMLSYTERNREYATLRVLGFYNSEIKSLIFKDSAFNIIIGLILGIPCGFQFLKIYVNVVSTSTIKYFAYLNIASFVIALGITIGCSLAVCYLVSKKVKSIDMVEALKSIE
ncbi:MAG TPA: ABC transporter permease, partial [Oscillospiraceae bacterium]|nr:ABC transporter permease [Oscillospiraceae bacterium]